MTIPNITSDFTQKEIDTFKYYNIGKERLCIKADGSLGKYTKFQAFFVKMFSFINKISFDRDSIIDRITILKAQFEKTVGKNLQDFTFILTNNTGNTELEKELMNKNLRYVYGQLDEFFGETYSFRTLDSNLKKIVVEGGNYIERGLAF